MPEIAIIGGGAGGMMAALTAAEKAENRVTLFERQARVGRKLLSTGNGRCNLTNEHCAPEHYHSETPDFCVPALEAFDVHETLSWFHARGLVTVTEESGRVYPLSNAANSVLDVLRLSMEQARFQSTEAEITHKADRMQDEMKKLFLAKNCEDYIESRGMEMGLKIRRVSIELEQGAGGEWLPFSASVFAAGSETEVKELSRLLASELGIPIERQVWTLNE